MEKPSLFQKNSEQEENDQSTTSRIKIHCPIHPKYFIENVCINKNCTDKNIFQCFKCFKYNNNEHQNHIQDLLEIADFQDLKESFKQSQFLQFQQIFSNYIKQENQDKESFQENIEIIFQQILTTFEESLMAVKKEILISNSQLFQEEKQNYTKTQYENYQQQLFDPLQKMYDILKNTTMAIQIPELQQQGKLIHNIFHNEVYQTLQNDINKFNKKIENQQLYKIKVISLLESYKLNYSKNQFIPNKINTDYKRIEVIKEIIQKNYKGLSDFTASNYKESAQLTDLAMYKEQSIVTFQNNNNAARIYSNAFKYDDLVIFKCKVDKAKEAYFVFGLSEENLSQENKADDFGSYQWLSFDNGDKHYKEEFVKVFNGKKNMSLRSSLNNGDSEFLIIIKPSLNCFVVFDFSTKLIIKNIAKFENLQNNDMWNFHIVNGKMQRNIQINNNITENDIKLINEYNLL